MAAYKDEQRGTWYVSFHYYDWTEKSCRKAKKGFRIKRKAAVCACRFRKFSNARGRRIKLIRNIPKTDATSFDIDICYVSAFDLH